MKLGRKDYDATVRDHSIPSDEPRFLLRGQDVVGADAVRGWARLAADQGVPNAVIEQALQQADAMDAWPHKKIPDDSHLSEGEAAQLAYQLERRRWNRGEMTTPDEFVERIAVYGRMPLSTDPVVREAVLKEIIRTAREMMRAKLTLRPALNVVPIQGGGLDPQA